MVFYIGSRGSMGFSIYSENNEIMIGILGINVQVPIETVVEYRESNGIPLNYGRIRFETDNEIVIKDKIAYIR